MKVFLVLAAMVCISKAQRSDSGDQCLCQRVRNLIPQKSEIKDIQIYPATILCHNMEIVVILNSGIRYCLNPELKTVKNMLMNINKKKSTTVGPTEFTPTPSSTNTPTTASLFNPSPESRDQCVCQDVRNLLTQRSEIKDIQIYPPTIFCDNVEIVVTLNSGLRYCLNPEMKAGKKVLANMMWVQSQM